MFAALAAVPFLLHHLGQERLGVLSLIWVVVGYFSFLDMGLGRAVTVAVASCRDGTAKSRADELHILGTAFVLLLSVGSCMALILGLSVFSWGVPVRMSSPLFLEEVKYALLWMLPSLPLLLMSSVLRGYLEGVGSFRSLNLLRIPTGALLVLGPCLTALFSPDLVWACVSILIVRVVHVVVLLWLVAQETEFHFYKFVFALVGAGRIAWLRKLLSFGGWVTVSNIVGPVIVYLDRFIIGAVLAASSVVIYSVPFDLVSRLPILIASLCSVLLPELVRLSRNADGRLENMHTASRLVRRSSIFSALVVAVIVLLGWALTPWALGWWVGEAFKDQGTEVTQILLLAFGVNALSQIPFTALQAVGKVRAVAFLHCVELIPYALLVFFAVERFGLVGAAWAWLLRSVVDYFVLAWMWHKQTQRQLIDIKF